MLTYEVVRKNPRAFRNLTGIGLNQLDHLHQQLVPLWTKSEGERLNRPNRKRAMGGGHPYTLELEDQLLMTLLWLHLHLNTAALSFLFGVDQATVSRNTRRVWQLLLQLNHWPEPPKRGHGKTLEQAYREYPDLLVLVEGIEGG